MKVSKFSEQQIALILKQVDDGLGSTTPAGRPAGVSQQMVADLSLDKAMLQDVLSKKP
jgi:putative transposase